ncbi:hypothetical protein, partial [Methanocalculus sp.]|uniref:hypothetical protein n=1 Tax=Methanocalculus sp. TaxID=2004547 RepID=UPI0026173B74
KLLKRLHGETEDDSLFELSYGYARQDYHDLLSFGRSGYNREDVAGTFNRLNRRLQKVQRILSCIQSSDRRFNTDIARYYRYYLLYHEAIRYYRFTSLRDKGVIRKRTETFRFRMALIHQLFRYKGGVDLSTMLRSEGLPGLLKSFAGFKKGEERVVEGEINSFIRHCPRRYLARGLYAKYIGTLISVVKYAYEQNGIDYMKTLLLGSGYGKTYIFDEILDDRTYTREEKADYCIRCLSILNSRRGENITLSGDPLMAYTEEALIKIREVLSDERWEMVKQAYDVLAKASIQSSGWTFEDRIPQEEIYCTTALKGAYTRIIPAILAGNTITEGFIRHCIRSGLIYQLPDDLRDMPDDIQNRNVTPFNYILNNPGRLRDHPLEILLLAIDRISRVDYPDMRDAGDLYQNS